MSQSISAMVNAISDRVDQKLEGRSAEAILLHRVTKIGEELGEAIEALIGVTDGNFRKPHSHTMPDLQKELLDVALCALCAWSHTTGNRGDALSALRQHTIKVRNRAGLKP